MITTLFAYGETEEEANARLNAEIMDAKGFGVVERVTKPIVVQAEDVRDAKEKGFLLTEGQEAWVALARVSTSAANLSIGGDMPTERVLEW